MLANVQVWVTILNFIDVVEPGWKAEDWFMRMDVDNLNWLSAEDIVAGVRELGLCLVRQGSN